MQRRERASDERIAQPGEPVRAVGRQRLQIAADDVDEHQLAQAAEHALAAEARLLRLGHGELHERAERPAGAIADADDRAAARSAAD